MRLALAQMNSVVGDLDGNRERILGRLGEAKRHGADIVLFPELIVTGYPPEDLLLRPGFVRAAERSLAEIARHCRGITALVGTPHFDRDLYNACAVCAGGEVKAVYRKRFLPNYGVFDEDRYFAPGRDLILLELGNTLIGPTVCEDMWQPGPPATELALAGAELVVNISASPYHLGKEREREEMFITRARGFEEALLVVDAEPKEVIGRRLRDIRGRALARERETPPPVSIVHVGSERPPANGSRPKPDVVPFADELEQMRRALVLGLRDYVDKNGFREGVVVGVSGGIDSAVTAAVAVEALGPERVHCVSMPSQYSSEGTRSDARRLAESLGCPFRELPIAPIVAEFSETLADAFAGLDPDLTEENIQARIRGVLLMALSNK